MDTPIERKPGITRKHLYVIGGIAFVIAVVLYFIFRDTTSSMTVEKERLTIATVNRGEFNDYIRVIGQVMPNRIIYMDAVEGGRVEERLKEEGAMVKAGDVIEVRESSRSSAKFAKLTGPEAPVVALPAWLNREAGTLKGVVAKLPERSDIDYEVAEHLIVELYSK